jgi:predicted GNAT superfamily acetyltransferase
MLSMGRSALASGALIDDAVAYATKAAEHSGVSIEALDSLQQVQQGAALLVDVWGAASESSVVPAELLRALSHSGNYVTGAYQGDRLVGVSVGFLGQSNGHAHLHSHISGVATDVQHRSIGFALKLHQRAWSLLRGIDKVLWTFDPLVRRNAYFNLGKLGARVTEFHPDFYGRMADSLNNGDETDRAVVEWNLLSPTPRRDQVSGDVILRDRGDGQPEVVDGNFRAARLTAWVPDDIVELRRKDPNAAVGWRKAMRQTFGRAIEEGYAATNMTRDGWYELERPKQ